MDFRERIRINGRPIPEEYVVRFVEEERRFFEPLHPSFFELTTAMAFRYFADEKIDVAVIEVGLGGRLDCTNIIYPDLCIITNISLDHTQFLGSTLTRIAREKAGIIKNGIPVVIGETHSRDQTCFFGNKPESRCSHLFCREKTGVKDYPGMEYELKGFYQKKNSRTILTALPLLEEAGYRLDEQSVRSGFAHVIELTGLMGRWQKLQDHPTLICDTGLASCAGGITYIVEQLKQQTFHNLHIIIGMVSGKDIQGVLALLPKDAVYCFCPSLRKTCYAGKHELQGLAASIGLKETAILMYLLPYGRRKEKASRRILSS
ncbi:bifunctional folylpolyglutamate synthase/dihydrofolate synthase [Bacteroides sp. KG121]|uniref:bifunctional folylpolyglutamate synthase/dihydrofolate synthase n=1 Tax=Bacteroides sp. KG121 TaxID=3397826 RepID=UPI003D98BA6B